LALEGAKRKERISTYRQVKAQFLQISQVIIS
jgi:hypothetical protein